MNERLVAREVAGLRFELPRLRAGGRADRDRRAERKLVRANPDEFEEHPLAALRIVAADEIRLLQIHRHEIEVPIAIQIRIRRAVGDAHMIQPPRRAHILEIRLMRIAEGAIHFRPHRPLLEKLEHVFPVQHLERHVLVRIVHVPRDAVRAVHIQPAVVVEIRELHRPRPVRARQAEKSRAFPEMPLAGIQQQDVLHVLRRLPVHRPFQVDPAQHTHRRRGLEVRRHRHVADHQIRQQIIVDVAEIRAHGKPRRVRDHLRRDIGKSAVAIVPVEFVRRDEIVPHVNIRPPVAIEIPHRHRKPVAPA